MKQETLNLMVLDLLKENPDATVKDFYPYVEEVIKEVQGIKYGNVKELIKTEI